MSDSTPQSLQLLAAMHAAREQGDQEEVFRLYKQYNEHMAELTRTGSCGDAAPEPEQPPPIGGENIDWENVASEVKTMLSLNPGTGWQEMAEEVEQEEGY